MARWFIISKLNKLNYRQKCNETPSFYFAKRH
jgi:hypothetical protein